MDKDNSGSISIQEFKAVLMNEEANKIYRESISKIRDKGIYKGYLPRNVTSFFTYLSS